MTQHKKEDNVNKSNYAFYGNQGLTLTFSNGYTISIQCGPGNYSTHKSMPSEWRGYKDDKAFLEWYYAPRQEDKLMNGWHSGTAEIAIWTGEGKDKEWKNIDTLLNATFDGTPTTDTEGWVTTDEVAKLIQTVASIRVKGNKLWDKLKLW